MQRLVPLVLAVGVLSGVVANTLAPPPEQAGDLPAFTSKSELERFLKEHHRAYSIGVMEGPLSAIVSSDAAAASDYSTTNVQVAGVDEADIVKSDGKYLYVVSGPRVFIVDAFPAEFARVVAALELGEGTPIGIYVNGDRLVIFVAHSRYSPPGTPAGGVAIDSVLRMTWGVEIRVYDIRDRPSPALVRQVIVDGSYVESRMVGGYVYVILNVPTGTGGEELALPTFSPSQRGFPTIHYLPSPSPKDFYSYTNILAVPVKDDAREVGSKVILLGSASTLYASTSNLYLIVPSWGEGQGESSTIHKLGFAQDEITYRAHGSVPGTLLNQFSMDEHNGFFRIATTSGHVSRSAPPEETSSTNHVYVLNEALILVGALERIAPNERIYSARFLGDKAYLVTFKKVDPFFVLDLSDPRNPRVLGELKLPGYSDYLHPYDETHVIGVGKDTIEAEEGNFAWYQGVKLALFDVSDPSNPTLVASRVIGDRGTDSEALRDHKAFLFDPRRELLVLPIRLAEIDETRYPGGVPPHAPGEIVWQGAYVFTVTPQEGFALNGRITHSDGTENPYPYGGSTGIRRSLHIEDVLYTLSQDRVQFHSVDDLRFIGEIELDRSPGKP